MRKESFKRFVGPETLPRMSQCDKYLSLPELTEYALKTDVGDIPKAEKICMFGIGESSIAGDIVSSYADDYSPIPVINITSDIVPGWVDMQR